VQKLSFSLLTATLVGWPSLTHAEQLFLYGADKEFIQTSASKPNFDGGAFRANFRDGNAILNAACPLNGSLFAFGAAPLIGCFTGSTGLVSAGDFDGDGYQDNHTYWELTNVIPADKVEPFRPELCKLVAAPVSSLDRPLDGFVDRGLIIDFDTRFQQQQYEVALYEFEYPYGDVDGIASDAAGSNMSGDWKVGQYVFQFPVLGRPDIPRSYLVRLFPFLEGYNTSTGDGRKDFKFLGKRWDSEGYYQLDPRLSHAFSWQVPKNKLLISDKLFFSIASDQDFTPYDEIDDRFFPANGFPLRLAQVQTSSYNFPPGFFHVGQTAEARLEYTRTIPISAISYDTSSRAFRLPLRFIESYGGYSVYEGVYPPITNSAKKSASKLMAAKADFDGDGLSNVTEFGLMTDPAGTSLAISAITSTATTFTLTVPANHGRTAGEAIRIEGVTPADYNGMWTIAAVTETTITVNSDINPGVATTVGTFRRVVGAYPSPIVSISSTPTHFIIRARNHGKSPGDQILISGNVSKAAYKGVWTVSEVTQDELDGNVVNPGTIIVESTANPGTAVGGVVKLAGDVPSSINAITSTATSFSITSAGHSATIGDLILIQGATPAGYNGLWTVSAFTPDIFDDGDPPTLLQAGTLTVTSSINLGNGTGGTVQQFVPDLASVTEFGAEVDGESYDRVHDGGVIRITMLKRPNTGTSISYGIETKATLATKKWSKTKTGSVFSSKIHWIVEEDNTSVTFTSDGTVPLTTLVRPAVTQNF
jgi:hypothetical protein